MSHAPSAAPLKWNDRDPFYTTEPVLAGYNDGEKSVYKIVHDYYRDNLDFYHEDFPEGRMRAQELADQYLSLHQAAMREQPMADPFLMEIQIPGYEEAGPERPLQRLIQNYYAKHFQQEIKYLELAQQYQTTLLNGLDRKPYAVVAQELQVNPEAEGSDKEEAFIVLGKRQAEALWQELALSRPKARITLVPIGSPSGLR